MKYFLSSFGLHNPYIHIDFADHLVYPIAIEFSEGFDLDYGMLLVGEEFQIDESVFEFIRDDKRGFLKPMFESLERLKREGLLRLFDAKQLINQHKNQLIEKTEFLSSSFNTWLPILRKQWGILEETRSTFVSNYGDLGKKILNGNHFTLVNAVYQIHGNIQQNQIDKYHKIIFSRKMNFSKSETEIIKEVIKPLICHLLIHDLIKHETKCTLLDWDDAAPYYDNLYLSRWDSNSLEKDISNRSRKILNLMLPQLKPNMIESFIKFIRDDKASSSLRKQIVETIEDGTEINEHWLMQYQNNLIKGNLKRDNVMKKVRFGSSVLGLFLPGSTLATEVLIEGSNHLGESGIEKAISKGNRTWYYAMQDVVES